MKDICHTIVVVFFLIAFAVTALSSWGHMTFWGVAKRVCHPYNLATFDEDAKVIVCYTADRGMELRKWPTERRTP